MEGCRWEVAGIEIGRELGGGGSGVDRKGVVESSSEWIEYILLRISWSMLSFVVVPTCERTHVIYVYWAAIVASTRVHSSVVRVHHTTRAVLYVGGQYRLAIWQQATGGAEGKARARGWGGGGWGVSWAGDVQSMSE